MKGPSGPVVKEPRGSGVKEAKGRTEKFSEAGRELNLDPRSMKNGSTITTRWGWRAKGGDTTTISPAKSVFSMTTRLEKLFARRGMTAIEQGSPTSSRSGP